MRPDLGCLRVSGLLGALGVGLGAFGAHGLRDLLQRNGTADIWETAVFYHLVHAVAMLALSLFGRATRGPWTCFLAGVLIFSGSLYALAITNVRGLGAITPIGGVAMIAGWVWLLVRPPADPVPTR